MEFQLFGEVQLRAGGQLLDVGTPRQQAVLAALAVDAGRPVAIETLIDRVWNDAPPVGARNVLYSHLSRIRQLLKRATALTGHTAQLDRRQAGYVLDVDPDLVDLHRFSKLADHTGGTDAERARALAEALALWRGPPLAGLHGEWVSQVRDSWDRRRLAAVVQWVEVELKLGHCATVISSLPDFVAEYPLAEPLEALLMRALHAVGQDAEALDRYAAVRRRLADGLGIDPGVELRALHVALLRGELPAPEQKTGATGTPAQLPPEVSGFAGRDEELRQLNSKLASDRSTAVMIITVSGTAGVGKTALAVRWAHQVRDEFPGGQLYVNLRGFDPTGLPVAPAGAVRGFLDAFEVPPDRIPASFDAQVGLYRSLLTGRRVLVVLDNAHDAEQVRPLLPGSPGCLVLVTSRNQLSGLVASGAHPLTLDLLSAAEARELLARRLGADRVAAEPSAVDEIVSLSARLPLALAVVAARAAMHPAFSLAVLSGELRATRGGLDEFVGADPATDARAVFSWSYLQLSTMAAWLFRLLGLHPGPDIATRAVASMAGSPIGKVRPLLAELAEAHLLSEHSPGRYACHDLLRVYAFEQAQLLDSEDERRAVLQRALGHYVHSANSADLLLDPHRDDPPAVPSLPAGVVAEHMTDHAQALAWFDAERHVLLTVLRRLTAFDAEVWQLAWTMQHYLNYQGHYHDSIAVFATALEAAHRLADPLRQAFAHRSLGCAYIRFGRFQEARIRLDNALDLYRQAGAKTGEAYTHHYYAWMLDRQKQHRLALQHSEQSLELFRSVDHRAGQALAVNAIGWFHALLGSYEKALDYCGQALTLQEEVGDQHGQATTWDSLGLAHRNLGHHEQAAACYQVAIDLSRRIGYRSSEAFSLSSLGDAYLEAGNFRDAGIVWRQALDVYESLGHLEAESVRVKIDGLAGLAETPGRSAIIRQSTISREPARRAHNV